MACDKKSCKGWSSKTNYFSWLQISEMLGHPAAPFSPERHLNEINESLQPSFHATQALPIPWRKVSRILIFVPFRTALKIFKIFEIYDSQQFESESVSTETVEHGTPSGKRSHDSGDNSYKSTFFGGGHSALGCLGYTFHTYVGTASKAGAWKSQQALSDRHKSTIWAPLASEVFSSLVMSLVSIIVQESFCHGNSSGIDLFELNLSSFCKFWTKILGKPVQPSPLGTADNVVDVEAKFVQASHCRKCMSRGMSEPNPGDVSTSCLWMKSITKVVVYECLQ